MDQNRLGTFFLIDLFNWIENSKSRSGVRTRTGKSLKHRTKTKTNQNWEFSNWTGSIFENLGPEQGQPNFENLGPILTSRFPNLAVLWSLKWAVNLWFSDAESEMTIIVISKIEIGYPKDDLGWFGAKFRTRFKVGVRMRPKVRGQAHSRQSLNGISNKSTQI